MDLASTWKCSTFEFELTNPLIMGIVNVTPDSFSDGGKLCSYDDALAYAHTLLSEGADIIDVGGESTRPGSSEVSVGEEERRVIGIVSALAAEGVCVSVDTRHVEVARAALDAGASIINDVSGFRDRAMCELAFSSDAGLVVMHMAGEPKHMQDAPAYEDVVAEVEAYLLRAARRLEAGGVAPERICIDPGIGFGKSIGHNAKLLASTRRLAGHGYPLMVAVSRKSYIGECSKIDAPDKRDAVSALCAAAAIYDGARIARVHNVSETLRGIRESKHAVISLGSNMNNPKCRLDDALDALRSTPGIWIHSVSSYVVSEPAYVLEQPFFVNAVALIQTSLSPRSLLEALHGIEDASGRVRDIENGPRALDLDIVDYEGVVSEDPALALPHPKALERDFVVSPLLEISPAHVLADGVCVTREGVRVGRIIEPKRS